MRVLTDTNLFIAYLLKPRDDSVVSLLLDAVIEEDVILLMPAELLAEINHTIKRKPHLIRVITKERLDKFLSLLQSICEEIPLITTAIPAITRDPKDDYLIAYALVSKADYLVTGDKDLLVLEQVESVKIVDAREFRQVLGHTA